MFLPLFSLFRCRILLKPSYNSCSGAITCTNMISHGMPDSACKKVFACKVKMKNLFSLQLQQNFLVQQCFCRCFPFSVVGFYSNRLTTVAVVQLLVQTSFRTGVFGGFPLHIAFYDKKDIFRQNLPLTCAWRDVQLQRQVSCTAKSQPFCTVYFLFGGTVEVFVRLR